MTVAMDDVRVDADDAKVGFSFDWNLFAQIFGATVLVAAAAFETYRSTIYPVDFPYREAGFRALITLGVLLPTLTAWLRAVRDGRLAWLPWREPRHDHISGWGVLALGVIVAAIIWLVLWASTSPDNDRTINQSWGFWVVVGLAGAFLLAAVAPAIPRLLGYIGLSGLIAELEKLAGSLIRPIGSLLSHIDSILVYAVAGSVGPERRSTLLRYYLLLSVVGACGVLGYYLSPPLAFFPLAWGFLVTISMSRRWIWIEEDRERAMTNPKLARTQTRIGFSQNLRDEALISFMSMFLLVPIALRQAQLLAMGAQLDLFTIDPGVDVHDLRQWIGFYGTELAKAVPFVDWAEVYDVSGDATIEAHQPLALHLVFGTRVLIDLVFLAALLQAISIASRDANQKDRFYRKRDLTFLDPFTEPATFRTLVKKTADGEWESTGAFDDFPKYDPDRLVELSASRDSHVRVAAQKLIERDNVSNNPHFVLSNASATRPLNKNAVAAAIEGIRSAGSERNVYQLDLSRRRLNSLTGAHALRKEVITLLGEAEHSQDKIANLIAVLIGDAVDPRAECREVALESLAKHVNRNERVRTTIKHVAAHDAAQRLRKLAQNIIDENPDVA